MALAFRPFGVFDYEKMILLAYAVRDVHEFLERTIFFRRSAVFMGFKSPAVNAVGIIENAMQMYMTFINMASHKILILAFEKLLTYLLTVLQSSFGSYFTGLETDNEVLGENGTSACSVCPYFFIVTVSLFGNRAATLCDNQPAVIRLVGIGDVFQCCKLIS